jgi:ATP-dependent helicase/nuclease subunit B
VELTKKHHPDKQVEPAGIFYYHIDNPIVDGDGHESDAEIREAVFEQLKLNGVVCEERDVYRAMDVDFTGTSTVIPVAEKADGSLKATSKTMKADDFATLSDYVNRTITHAGQQIMAGDIAVNPYELEKQKGCDYCPYHTVCGFDVRMEGFRYRTLEKISDTEELLTKMKGEADGSEVDE